MTTAELLTPPGTAAIAVIAVRGSRAWPIVRELFSKPLPELPPPRQFWLGTLCADDVIVAAVCEDTVEIHCHGGRQIVRAILESLHEHGCREAEPPPESPERLLPHALTLRAAGVLLDQLHGAFDAEVQAFLKDRDIHRLRRLAERIKFGQRLTQPWSVVIAGAPNAGKSSLINALAGFERAIVAPTPGTTRDAVSSLTALDGWPVELIDTAGLRAAEEAIEAAGIAKARQVLEQADLVVWLYDANAATGLTDKTCRADLIVANKCDQPHAPPPQGVLAISALTGEGVPGLAAAIVRKLVPVPPEAGAAVPVTASQANQIQAALTLAEADNFDAACTILTVDKTASV